MAHTPKLLSKTLAPALLPVKVISFDKQNLFIDLTNKLLALKKQYPSANTSALENEIDQLVYALYDLTPEEIAIVEGKAVQVSSAPETVEGAGA